MIPRAAGYHPRMSEARRGAPASLALPIVQSRAPRVRPSRSTRWRFAVLFAVQGVIILHIVQWLWSGRTLSPVEPSEAMATVKDGIINAGTVFFALALLSTVIFGRFFCGWGCHVLLLQDGCGWLLKKVGIRPRPFKSRLLMLVPLGLALYMFVWPLAYRWAIAPYTRPELRWPGFSQEFIVTDFWATFPGVLVAVPFLFVCGALIVYFLGQKGYCTYGCPYGGFFAPIDRVSPMRIRVTDACDHSGHCTAVCTSNVRVHEEVARYRMVVDQGCMKCLDCVSVCPNDALYVGWGRTALGAVPDPAAQVGPRDHRIPVPDHPAELSRREEVAVLSIGVLTLLATNAPFMPVLPAPFMPASGIKVALPLLFSSGIAAIVAFLAWKSWRILGRANEGFHGISLRRRGRISVAGGAWLAMSCLSLALVAVVGAQNLLLLAANIADRRIAPPSGSVFSRAGMMPPPAVLRDIERADWFYEGASLIGRGGIGFVPAVQPFIDIRRASLAAMRRDYAGCERFLRSAWSFLPDDTPAGPELATEIGRALWAQGRMEDLLAWNAEQISRHPHAEFPHWERFHRETVALFMHDQNERGAIDAARAWLEWNPASLEAMRRLSLLLVEHGDAAEVDEGIALVHRTLEIEPGNAGAWRAIAIGHARLQRLPETEEALRRTVELAPEDWRFWQGLGEFYRGAGRDQDASFAFDRATRLRESELATMPAPLRSPRR